jgi:hypothetical protein
MNITIVKFQLLQAADYVRKVLMEREQLLEHSNTLRGELNQVR